MLKHMRCGGNLFLFLFFRCLFCRGICFGSVEFAVDALDRGAFEADAGSFLGGLKDESLFLHVHDSADDAADGGDFIADGKTVSHLLRFLFLLFLGADHEEIHDDEKKREDQKAEPAAAVCRSGGCCFQKHGDYSSDKIFKYESRAPHGKLILE